MKRNIQYPLLHIILIFFTLATCTNTVIAQQEKTQVISLNEAVQLGLQLNKDIQSAQLKTAISENKLKDFSGIKIPDVNFHTNYTRITNLGQYQDNSKAKVYESIPELYDITLNASVPLFTGGKIRAEEAKLKEETILNKQKAEKTATDVKLDIITSYLQLYHLLQQKALIEDNIKEDTARLKQVQAMKNHGAVTRNEVLRSELQLSNHQLTLTTTNNNINIALHSLKTLLEIPEDHDIMIDTSGIIKEQFTVPNYKESLATALQEKDELKIAGTEERIKELEKKQTKGNYFPTVGLGGSYGLNYPNYKFFPPEPYLYRLGGIGVDVSFSITNLYKNKKKMAIAGQNIQLQELESSKLRDEVNDAVYAAHTKYTEAIERISISAKAIQQASENYRIVKSKYLNQLALITDMIDADNALLEARSAAITARIDAQLKYYHLQYAMGKL